MEAPPWWSEGLDFKCTGCGKCCKVKGEVWLSPAEMETAADFLKLNQQDFESAYVQHIAAGGWGLLKEKIQSDGTLSCTFLDDNNQCGIYEARPLQCSTYPFWPRLLRSPSAWDAEAVAPEDWTPERGGCEAINAGEGWTNPEEIKLKSEMQAAYIRRLPHELMGVESLKINTTAEMKKSASKLRVTASEVKKDDSMIEQTKKWVKDVVIAMTLCPFARSVYEGDTVRYTVRKETSPKDVYNLFLDEVDLLFKSPEDEIATTLIILSKAFSQDFEAYYMFCEFLEETIEANESLGEKLLIACFHPQHTFAGLDEDDPLHWEKRSPYPTINLLRAERVDEYAAEGLTQRIGENNDATLKAQGHTKLEALFKQIMWTEGGEEGAEVSQ